MSIIIWVWVFVVVLAIIAGVMYWMMRPAPLREHGWFDPKYFTVLGQATAFLPKLAKGFVEPSHFDLRINPLIANRRIEVVLTDMKDGSKIDKTITF